MPQVSPIIPLLREAYPSSFATQPDANVRDYFYRLMFEPASFGGVKQGQTYRRQALSDMKQLAQQAMPGVTPPSDKDFVIWARKQALYMAPERPTELRERQAFSRKAFQYEQKFGDLAHPILFTEEFAKNLFGKPAASLVSLASIVPGVPREASQAVAEAISPRIDFGRHVTEKYGTVAGLGYSFGEALAGFGPVVSAAKLGAGLTAATRIPGIAQAAGAIARNETLFNTLFFGSYSAGEYNRSMLEQGKEPTAGGFAANLGAGAALGYFFPKAKKVFRTAKEARPWVNTVLAPMLEKKVADIKTMNPSQLRAMLIDKGYKSRKDITHALESVRFVRAYKGSITKDLLKQSTKAGVLGAATGGVSQATQGMPIDMPSLIQNAVFMMGFHAHGIAGAFGKPLGRAKPGKVEDGVLKLGVEGHRRKLIDAFKPFFEEPDIAPERGIAEFARVLRETYGVEKIEVEKGEFKSLGEFLELVDPAKLPEKTKTVIGRIGRARAEKDFMLASKEEALLDGYFAQMARAKGESPTEVPFGELEAADVPTVKRAQTMYMWLNELIGNNVGREAQDVFRRGLGTDMMLSERAATEPQVARILERFPAAEAVERLFDATVRGLEVSPELWQAAKMFTVPRGLLKAAPERRQLPSPERPLAEEMPPELMERHITPKSVEDLRGAGFIREGAKIVEKDGIVVVEKGRQEKLEGGKIVPGEMYYDVYQLGKSTSNVEIKKGITTGSTVSEATIRKFGFPIPGEKKPPAKPKPIPPTKPKPEEMKPIKMREKAAPPVEEKPSVSKYRAKLYQGQGASLETVYGKKAVEQGRAVPILGRGDYFATSRKEAALYGKVTEKTVELSNPKIIDSSDGWRQLLRDADVMVLESTSREHYEHPERIAPATEKLQKYLISKGYDGAIIKIPEGRDVNARGESIKRLRESFGHSQVVKFATEAKKPLAKPKLTEAELRAKEKEQVIRAEEAKLKEKPAKVEKREVKAPTVEEARELLTLARMIGPATGVNKADVGMATSPETLPRMLEVAKRLGVKTRLDDPLKLDPHERQIEVNKVYQAMARAIHSSTRQPGDPVTFKDDFGLVVSYNPKNQEYRILSLITGRTGAEKWHLLDRVPDEDVLRRYKVDITRTLNAHGLSAREIANVMATVRGSTNKIFSMGIDPEYLGDLAGAKKEQMLAAIRGNPSVADKLGELGRMLHTWRSTHDPFLMHLSRFLFHGDPQKLVTPKQWGWINKAVEFNRTNPYMNDGRGGTINAEDFVQVVLGRRNYHPEFAKESGQPFEPMTREDARDVLKAYAKVSEAIRDRNWPLALKVFLPVAMKKYSPRVEREWDALYMYEGNINGIRAKKDRFVHEWNAAIGKGDEINSATRTAKFKEYNNRKYGHIWKLSREHGWMPEGKENRWENGRTLAQEFHGLTTGIIPWSEPFLHPKVVEAARAWANPLKPKGRYVMSFRDEAWHFLNNGLKRFEYPLVRGRMYADTEYFRDVYTHWKMQSEKTTPENSDAMRARFEKEADKILTNEKRKTVTINAIMESKKLGKIVDAKDRNIYYPFFDPKFPEKLLEAEAMVEEGKLPSGALGKLMHAQHRKATVEYHVATGEFDPVRDINTYVENMTSYLWRAATRYHTWRGTKNIRRDIIENPQYAKLFQRHIEIMEKLRSDLLDRQDGPIHRLSQNVGLMASGIMLAHPKTVFRNIMGGHALTAIDGGLRDFGEGWAFRKTPTGKRIVQRMGFEAGALFSEAESMTIDPKRFRVIMARKPNAATEHQVDGIVRLINSYALSRPLPFVTDLIPGLQDLTKGVSFAGSEVGLRETAYLSGFKSGVRRVMDAPRRQDKIRVIYGNSPKEMLMKVEKQYAEIEITPDDVLTRIKENPAKYKGAKKFMLKIVGPETNAEKRTRAYRMGIRQGAERVMFTQFIYSNLNRPSVMAHPLGRVVLLFRKYTWNRFNFASKIIKEAMPQRGGGPEEFARLMRFAIALSAAKALGAYIGFNLYRFVEDDVVSMLASVNDWFSEDPDRRRQATFGKPAWQFLTGPEFSRNIDVLTNADMETWEKALTVSHLPYSRAAIDVYREHQKVAEGRKNVYEALMNFHFGLYRYNYGGTGRRRRAPRRSR